MKLHLKYVCITLKTQPAHFQKKEAKDHLSGADGSPNTNTFVLASQASKDSI